MKARFFLISIFLVFLISCEQTETKATVYTQNLLVTIQEATDLLDPSVSI